MKIEDPPNLLCVVETVVLPTFSQSLKPESSRRPALVKLQSKLVLAIAVNGDVGGVKSEVYNPVPFSTLILDMYPFVR